ncbi:hypothetical protein ACH5RR_028994 [Cinchona calisaya]|uniref:F-box domain-containing protein n=1 Tax=Cinchona calisaya TaxID=153742 RepID=A0ABD2YQF8_9GENT
MAEQPKRDRQTPPSPSLNDLPENLLLHILTFLPLITAISISLISKKWRNLWHSLPSLDFSIIDFLLEYFTDDSDSDCYSPEILADFVTHTLLHRPNTFPLREFRLQFHYTQNHRHRSLVSTSLQYALDCSVTDLLLSFDVRHIIKDIIDDDDDDSRFENLRVVKLVDVDIGDRLLSDLISRCEYLEKLVLSRFRGVRQFRIFAERLEELELLYYFPCSPEEYESSVEINAPYLRSLKIEHFYVAKYYSTDLSSVVEAELNFYDRDGFCLQLWCSVMSLLTGVKRLSVQNMWFGFINSKIESSEHFAFKNLSHLELKTGYTMSDFKGLAALFVQSPGLETLVLDYVYDTDKVIRYGHSLIEQCLFDIPTLRKVKMKNFRITDNEILVLALMKMGKVLLERVTLTPAQLVETSCKGSLVVDLNAAKFLWLDS